MEPCLRRLSEKARPTFLLPALAAAAAIAVVATLIAMRPDPMRELLLCPPNYYGIEYEINPWMSRARGAEIAVAQKQWEQLHATL